MSSTEDEDLSGDSDVSSDDDKGGVVSQKGVSRRAQKRFVAPNGGKDGFLVPAGCESPFLVTNYIGESPLTVDAISISLAKYAIDVDSAVDKNIRHVLVGFQQWKKLVSALHGNSVAIPDALLALGQNLLDSILLQLAILKGQHEKMSTLLQSQQQCRAADPEQCLALLSSSKKPSFRSYAPTSKGPPPAPRNPRRTRK